MTKNIILAIALPVAICCSFVIVLPEPNVLSPQTAFATPDTFSLCRTGWVKTGKLASGIELFAGATGEISFSIPGEKEAALPILCFAGKPTACDSPTLLSVTDITYSGASIRWTGAADAYEYAVSTSSTPPVAGATPISTSSESVTGLSPATYYFLHVRSVCSGKQSSWATSVPFRTKEAPGSLIAWVPSGQMNFGVNPFPPTSVDSRLSITGLTRGAGVRTATSGAGSVQAAADAWGGYGWLGHDDQDVRFTVAANPGYLVSFSTLLLSYRISNTGPQSAVLRYAIDTGNFTTITNLIFTATADGSAAPPVDLGGIAALQNLAAGTVVTFQILPQGGGGSGTFYFFNEGISVIGILRPAVPPPVVQPPAEVNPACFIASWLPVPNATNYIINVTRDGFSVDNTRTVLAGWNFKTDLLCNDAISANAGKVITTVGAAAPTPSSGTARADNWTNGNGNKYWEISVNTVNFDSVRLSSRQRSSGTGPRDFKLQYKVGAAGTYTDVPGGAIPPLADNYAAGVINQLLLPAICSHQPTIFIRWLMTSNTSVSGEVVGTAGASNIDDIVVSGQLHNATMAVAGFVDKATGNVTRLPVTGLAPATKYYYTVRAVVNSVTGTASNLVPVSTIDVSAANYRSRKSGHWYGTGTWEYMEDCGDTWISASAPPGATNNITIQAGHLITLDANATVGNGKLLTITDGGGLITGSYHIGGAGSFDLKAGGRLFIGSASGIEASGNAGNIGVSGSRHFSALAHYVYNGTANQATGSGLPAFISGSLTISNTATPPGNFVTLTGGSTVVSHMGWTTTASLVLNNHTLTINNASGNVFVTGSPTDTLQINGGSLRLYFSQTNDSVGNALSVLTITGGTTTLGNKLAIYNCLSLSGGTFDLAGQSLVLKSNATGTARVAPITGTLAGDSAVTVERYIPRLNSRKWRLVTAPVLGTSIHAAWQEGMTFTNGINYLSLTNTPVTPVQGFGTLITGHGQGTAAQASKNGFDYWDLISNAAASVRKYVGAPQGTNARWAHFAKTTSPGAFDNSEAYLLFVRGDRSVSVAGDSVKATTLRATGTLRKGVQKFTIYGSAVQSHTLIGNPYAAPLDFDRVFKANPGLLKRYFWMLNAGLSGSYGAYQLIYGLDDGSYLALPTPVVPGTGATGNAADAIIESGSAFLAVPAAPATKSNGLVITENHKASLLPTNSVFRVAGDYPIPAQLYINLCDSLTSGSLLDGTLALWQPKAKTPPEEVIKVVNTGENLSFLKGGKDLIVAAQAPPAAGDTLQLHLWNTAAKTYFFQFRTVGLKANGLLLFLYDGWLKKKTAVMLTDNTVFSIPFTITAAAGSRSPLRFFLLFETPMVPLSVLFTGITAAQQANGAAIRWRVANEQGNEFYDVEKSDGVGVFRPFARVKANAREAYEVIDPQPSSLAYYRVRLTNADGRISYSAIAKLKWQGSSTGDALVTARPGGLLFLHWRNKPAGQYCLTVYAISGQKVAQVLLHHPGGNTVQPIGLKTKLAEGIYTVELKGDGKQPENAILLIH